MGKIIDNRQVIESPALNPLRYGLFNVARIAGLDAKGIAAGYQWTSDHCDAEAYVYDQTCITSPVKDFTEGTDTIGADPFWVVSRRRCGTVGRTAEEAQQAARVSLMTNEQSLVEGALWASIAATPPTIVTPTAAGAGAAIAALEAAFYAVYGYTGVIHLNTAGYAAPAYSNLVLHDYPGSPGVLRTPLGTALSIGAGYPTTGPTGAAPAAGFVWAFITGPALLWRTDILPQPPATQTLDRSANQWDTVAERVYIAQVDCPDVVYAVQVPVAAPAVATAPVVP